MDKLTYELKALCKHNRDGSHGTQVQRVKYLKLIAGQLKQLGYRHMGVQSLKAKHVKALVNHWRTKPSTETHKPIYAGTIKNRMAALRWWAGKIGKPDVIPKDNSTLGIPNRQRISNHNRAFKVSSHQHEKLPSYLKISVRLQQEFGLRREEAAKFVPGKAVKEHHIELKASWTKGGRPRIVPITTVGQRELLKEFATLKQNASLIPAKMDYKEYLSYRDHYSAIADIRKAHGLRHYYAQQRYIILSSGLRPPKPNIGEKIKSTAAERELDLSARLTVSKELGHTLLDIAHIYLG